MCRNCPVPEWSEPILVRVADLPNFFAKQLSWNFERLNYGNGAVMDSLSEKPERPTVTGAIGCRLRDYLVPSLSARRPQERYLLVSECLFCPGKRYGCTPRSNCTGKRRHCYAQCKVSIYADHPEMAEIYFAGSHGTGDITDVNKHRPLPAIINELKRKRKAGATPSEALEWFKKYAEDKGLDPEDPRLVPGDEKLRSLLKRTKKGKTLAPEYRRSSEGVPLGFSEQVINGSEVAAVMPRADVPWANGMCDTHKYLSSGDEETSATDRTQTENPVNVHVTFTPLNTPISTPHTCPSPTQASPAMTSSPQEMWQRGSESAARPHVSPACVTPLLSTSPSPYKSSVQTGATPMGHWVNRTSTAVSHLFQGKDHELATLKQHIHILEQEHLHKISRIAELETHLHLLMETKVTKLEQKVQSLKADSRKKDGKILHLEKQLQVAASRQQEQHEVSADKKQQEEEVATVVNQDSEQPEWNQGNTVDIEDTAQTVIVVQTEDL